MNSKSKLKPNYKNFWEGIEDSGHTFNTLSWYKKYSEEMLQYISNTELAVDCGCGSGEMLNFMSPNIKKIIGIDFSDSMLKKAEKFLNSKNIKNVDLIKGNFTNIDKIIKEKVNTIYNNGALQYLHFDETLEFIKNSKKILNKNGEIIFYNVPNIKYIDLYALRFFHSSSHINQLNLFFKYLKFKKDVFKEKLKNKNYIYDAGIGYWYSENDFEELSNLTNFNFEIYASKFLHYAYRFHVKLTLK